MENDRQGHRVRTFVEAAAAATIVPIILFTAAGVSEASVNPSTSQKTATVSPQTEKPDGPLWHVRKLLHERC